MKRFSSFGSYMFYLLVAPLKKSKSVNQLYIFFNTVGELFDNTKQDIFRLREETMIISASAEMLDIHGRDRDMVRLKGETVENYRIRLLMKNIIAERAGEDAAIYYVAKSFGYDNVQITVPDPQKWAEVEVRLVGGGIVIDDKPLLLKELNKIKPALALLRLSKEQRYGQCNYIGSAMVIGKFIEIRQV